MKYRPLAVGSVCPIYRLEMAFFAIFTQTLACLLVPILQTTADYVGIKYFTKPGLKYSTVLVCRTSKSRQCGEKLKAIDTSALVLRETLFLCTEGHV